MTFDRDAEAIDLGKTVVSDFKKLTAFLDELPNLKKCDMYGTKMKRADMEMLSERYPRWSSAGRCTLATTSSARM